jgi:subtilase family serine protease
MPGVAIGEFSYKYIRGTMPSRRKFILISIASCVLLLIPTGRSFTQVESGDRIVQAIDNNSTSVIKGNTSPWAQTRYDQGPVNESFQLSHMTMVFKPSPSQQASLDSLLKQLQTPSSPNYHKWLTPEQYASQYGLTENDLAKVVTWLQDQGFTVEQAARSRNSVAFSGTAAQVQTAFQTSIHNYVVNGVARYSNSTEPSIPSALSGVVLGIRGLNNYRPRPKVIRRSAYLGPKPNYTSSVSGNHYLVPADLATIYDIQSLYNEGLTGSGQKIAIMGQTDIVMNDISEFRANVGLPDNLPTIVTIPSYVSITSTGDLTEADLDLEWSGGVATAADIIYVNAGDSTNGAFDSLTYAIDQDVAPIISMTYGACEPDVGATDISTIQSTLAQATTEGITILAAAGDDGATDCDNNNPEAPSDIAVMGLAVDFTASSPNVTAIGGSEFSGDSAAGANTYWAGTNNSTTMGSALSYIPEVVWNDTATDEELSATGGGASMFFTKPPWQTGTGVPNDDARDVPDVSLTASPDEDPYLICSSDYLNTDTSATADCSSGFRATDGTLDVVGGTSAATPSFAGIMALLEQKVGSKQGNINEVLYPLFAKDGSAFHNITNGNNEEPCEAATPDCPNGGQIGFVAGTGYSQTTGLGSVNAFNLVSEWTSVAPITTAGAADFAVSPSPQNLSVAAGGSGTTTVTVYANNGFSGTVNLTCSAVTTLSGVTCSVSPSSVAGSGTATLTVSASSSASLFRGLRFQGPGWFRGGWVVLCGLLLLIVGVRTRRRDVARHAFFRVPARAWLGIALAGLLLAGLSCGGGSSSSSTTTTTTTTTTESGNVTVTGASGSLSHTTQVFVAVN